MKPWYELCEEEYDFIYGNKKYSESKLMAVVAGFIGRKYSGGHIFVDAYADRTWILNRASDADEKFSLDNALKKIPSFNPQNRDRFIIPISEEQPLFFLGKRDHWCLLCVDYRDGKYHFNLFDPKSKFIGYDTTRIQQAIENNFSGSQMISHYLGIQSFFNFTDCGFYCAEFIYDLVKDHHRFEIGARELDNNGRQDHFAFFKEATSLEEIPQTWTFSRWLQHYKKEILFTALMAGGLCAALTISLLSGGFAIPVFTAIAVLLTCGLPSTGGIFVAGLFAFAIGTLFSITLTSCPMLLYAGKNGLLFESKSSEEMSDFKTFDHEFEDMQP